MLPLLCALALFQSSDTNFELRVARADGGSLAGAEVRWFHGETTWRDFAALDERAAAGQPAALEQDGRVMLGPQAGPISAVATLPGWWGWTSARPDNGSGLVLTLHPDFELSATALGAGGLPRYDAPLRLRLANEVASPSTTNASVRLPWDPAATAYRLKHAEFLRRTLGAELVLDCDAFPPSAAPLVRLAERADERTFQFDLSGLRTLEAVALDASGQRVKQFVEFQLAYARDGAALAPLRAPEPLLGASHAGIETRTFSAAEGDALFHNVALDAGVMLFARRNGLSDWSGVHVPRNANTPSVRVGVQPARGCETIVLAPSLRGRPLTGVQLQLRRAIAFDPGLVVPFEPEEAQLALDAKGGARVDSVWGGWTSMPAGEVRLDMAPQARINHGLMALTMRGSDGVPRFALVDLRARAAAGEHLVPVEFEPERHEVSGVVRDVRNRPIEGGALGLNSSPNGWRRSPIGQVRVALDVEDGARSANGERRLMRMAVAYTDADGAFAIPCSRDGVFRLEASSRNRTSAVLEGVKSGAKLEITLAGRGDVFGLLRGAALDTSSLNVALLRTQGEPGGWSSSCSRDGRFEFSQIPPGRYSLLVRRVRSGEAPLELLHRTDLEVPADGVLDLGELSLD
ncbi:MAG: hypothetical protein JNN27_12430 [Planctomycetes bacterium]|nr:hypothetical protein [Planctomycetota bacterium]